MTAPSVYSVNAGRIANDFRELARISKSQSGITRLAFTEPENQAHKYIKSQMEEFGMETRTDDAGNLYGSLNGSGGKKIIVGSHLDSVLEGGNYDGALGVVMGLEAARVLKSCGFKHPLEVVAFRSEESARFGVSHIGSKLVTGSISVEDIKQIKDREGISAYSAIRSSGFYPDRIKLWDKHTIRLYIEPHIEQGGVLLDTNTPLGIVTGIVGYARYFVTVEGQEAHSGATLMLQRKDALAGFSEMHLALEKLAKDYERKRHRITATIGYVNIKNGAITKVSGNVSFPIDIRGLDLKVMARFEKEILTQFKEIGKKRCLRLVIEEKEKETPLLLNKDNYAIIAKAAKKLGVKSMELPSGAGHDAQDIALFGIPTAMLFVRNSGGSHNPKEGLNMKDVVTATEVLTESIVEARFK